MNDTDNQVEGWGYNHPSVKGPNALMFFTWDLSKTIEMAFREATDDTLEQFVMGAQVQIDALLQKYVDIGADPECFEGQSIKLSLERRPESQNVLLALQTSPKLEDRIIQMQARTQEGHS